MLVNRVIFSFFFLTICVGINAQGYLNFIENKGQWDAAILFKAEFKGGAIAFQKNGYRVLQNSPDDLTRVTELLHQHNNKALAANAGEQQTITTHLNNNANASVRSHVYEVNFFNANSDPNIVPEKALPTSNNYFIGNDTTKWGSNCKIYQALTYKNVYPNIDVRFYTTNGNLKYDIIVHPGGNPEQFILHFGGIDKLKIKNNALQIQTPVALHQETIPATYVVSKDSKKELGCNYYVKGNFVGFNINEPYDKSGTLVIDPSPVYASFSGSQPDNWGFTATYDAMGNMYTGGIVFSSGFPTTNGSTFGGGYDIVIMKYDVSATNSRAYATYIGGNGNEQPHSLVADKIGNLIIAGRTSSTNYPTKGLLKKMGSGGKYDIVLTKLNTTGSTIVGSVVIGGSENDGVNIGANYEDERGQTSTRRNYGDDARTEVILDKDQNILLASVTQSANFPIVNAFQTAHGSPSMANNQDGVLLKMNPTLDAVLNSSFIGGNDDDAAFVLNTHPFTGDIYVAGITASNNLGGDHSNVVYPTNQGALDGFITSIKSDFSQVIKTTYFGTAGIDVLFGIQFDKFGFPYVMGTTTGVFPPVNSPFDTKYPNQASGKHFVAKLSADLSQTIFLTNFGNGDANVVKPSLSLTAFLVDRCQNIYIAGWGGLGFNYRGYSYSTIVGLPVSADAYQKQANNDAGDFYFLVFSKDCKDNLYSTFFGQDGGFADHVDGGTSRFDPSGAIYQTFCSCSNRSSPNIRNQLVGTANAWASRRGNSECNMFSIRFDFNKAGVASGIRPSINGVVNDSVGCVPLTVNFEDTIAIKSQGKKFYWDFDGDGTDDDVTTVTTNSHVYTVAGNYRARLISEDLNTCNERDTSYINISAQNNSISAISFTHSVIDCSAKLFQFTNTTQLPASGGSFAPNSFEWDFGDGSSVVTTDNSSVQHSFPGEGTFKVRLTLKDPQFCNQNDYKDSLFFVANTLLPSFIADTVCNSLPTHFTYTGKGGQQFEWNFGDGATSNEANPIHVYSNSGKFTITLKVTDNNVCDPVKTKTISGIAVVSAIPLALMDYTPKIAAPNQLFEFTNASLLAVKYLWDFGDGSSFYTTKKDTIVKHAFPTSGTFETSLTAINAVGCSNKTSVSIAADVKPLFDVPNAFTPNADGVNDLIYVKGFGITKMTWRIYNRWGALVYLGTSVNEGWNGYYNGQLQPQDVYQYTLEVEFSDKVVATKKGDITLLR